MRHHKAGCAPGKLDGCLSALHSGVHGQHLVIPKELCDVLLKGTKGVIVECSGGQRQVGDLVQEGLDNLQGQQLTQGLHMLSREGAMCEALAHRQTRCLLVTASKPLGGSDPD